MVKILRDILIREDLRKLQGAAFGQKVKYFWRQGWEEMPEIMVFIPPTILGLLATGFILREQWKELDRLPRYYDNITIFRPNNPKVAKIRTDDYLSIESQQ